MLGDRSGELRSLASFAGVTLARQLLGFSSVFVANIYASAHMTVDAFAAYVAILNVVFLASGVGTLGIFPTVLYQLSRRKDCAQYCARQTLKFTGISALCTAGLYEAWQWYTGAPPNFVAAGAIVALAFSTTLPAIFIALQKVRAYNFSELSWQLAYLVLVLVLKPATSEGLLWIFLVSSSVRTACYVYFLVRMQEFWTNTERLSLDWSFFCNASVASVGYLLLFRLSFYVVYSDLHGALIATAWSWLERLLGLASAANSMLNAKVAGGVAFRRTIFSFIALVVVAFFGAELMLVGCAFILERAYLGHSYSGLAVAISVLAPGFLVFILRSNLQSVLMGLGHARLVRTDTVISAAAVAVLLGVIWYLPSFTTVCEVGLIILVCASAAHYGSCVRKALSAEAARLNP